MSTHADAIRRAVEAALPAAQRRAQSLQKIRDALESADDQRALELMRDYCGVQSQQAKAA